jgi:hypothetical protein
MLNSFEIRDLLVEQLDLELTIDHERIKGFQTKAGENIYLKTSKQPDLKPVHKNPLVVHPKVVKLKEQISQIDGVGVDWESFIHNSNLEGYPIRLHRGQKPIEHGYAVKIESLKALKQLLSLIDPASFIVEKNLLDEITEETASLPTDSTTRKRIVDARIGQGAYRNSLISLWGTCAVTNASTLEMLKASHIKPWKDSDNKERLDKFNGLLLSAHLDSAFDNGLISFADTGEIIISPSFTEAEHFSIDPSMKLKQVFEENKPYLAYHRTNVFQGTP